VPAQNYKNVINEWKMSASDPNIVDPTSRREVVSFGKTAGNHNAERWHSAPTAICTRRWGAGQRNESMREHLERAVSQT